MSDTPTPRPRRRGRGERAHARTTSTLRRLPTLERQAPPLELLDEERLRRLDDASLALLDDFGIDFRDAESLELWRAAGAHVEDERVRIPRALLEELLSTVPESFTLHARNPEATVRIGGNCSVIAPCYGAPVIHDLDGVRRDSTIGDFRNLARLAYQLPAAHLTGGVLCEPLDVAIPHRHLEMLDALIRCSDKPFLGMVTERERAEDSLAMARIVFGEDHLDDHAVLMALCNGNSPLVWDGTMLTAMKTFAAANQPTVCTPFSIAGANTPASVAGAAAQLNAEALAAVAFTQLVRRGAPVVYGAAISTVSMRSGAPMHSGPEFWQIGLVVGQLARRHRIPWRISAGRTASKSLDANAGYETGMNLFTNLLAGANLLLNAIGFMETALAVGYAKYLLDAEQCEMLQRFYSGVSLDDLDECMASVRKVGPGGHFLGEAHTLRHFEDAFFMPSLQFFDSFEQWRDNGCPDAERRALEKARAMLEDFEAPPLAPGIDDALRAYVGRRKREIPI